MITIPISLFLFADGATIGRRFLSVLLARELLIEFIVEVIFAVLLSRSSRLTRVSMEYCFRPHCLLRDKHPRLFGIWWSRIAVNL